MVTVTAHLPAQSAADSAAAQLARTADLVGMHSYPITIAGDSLTGPGAAVLLGASATAQFVGLGEPHNTDKLNRFAGALFAELHRRYGFQHAVVEQGADVTTRFNTPGVRGDLAATRRTADTWPVALHFGTDGELAFHATVGRLSTASHPLWGVDRTLDLEAGLQALAEVASSDEMAARVRQVYPRQRGDSSASRQILDVLALDVSPVLERATTIEADPGALRALDDARRRLRLVIASIPRFRSELAQVVPLLDSLATVVTDPRVRSELRGTRSRVAGVAAEVPAAPPIFDRDELLDAALAGLQGAAEGEEAYVLRALAIGREDLMDHARRHPAGEPWAYAASLRREELMVSQFLHRYHEALQSSSDLPRAVLKMGGWHVQRGWNPNMVRPLGSVVDALARTNGQQAVLVNVALVNPPGQQWSITDTPEGAGFAAMAGAAVDRDVLVDLRPLRAFAQAGRLVFDEDAARVLFEYDFYLLLGDTQVDGISWVGARG